MRFRTFRESIRNMGGLWTGNDVYFAQTQSQYTAAFLPEYPEKSKRDSTISCCWLNGGWDYSGVYAEELRMKNGCVYRGCPFYQTEPMMSRRFMPSKRLRIACGSSILNTDLSAIQYTSAEELAFASSSVFAYTYLRSISASKSFRHAQSGANRFLFQPSRFMRKIIRRLRRNEVRRQ